MAKKVRPIKPSEVVAKKKKDIPNEVFEAFNELITQNFDGHSATIKQDEVVALIVKKGLKRNAIFNNHWLDVEDVYRAGGWNVVYDKPGFNENYEAFFEFTPKR